MGRDSFGLELRAARERAGITLDAIAQSTKIKRSLLVGLEGNDLSQWPAGIFRRAFFRGYLAAIGLPSETLLAEFVRLFPDSPGSSHQHSDGFDSSEGELRLTLVDDTPPSRVPQLIRQAAAATSDLCAVLALTATAVGVFQYQLWPTAAGISLAYCFASVAFLGRTPGGWWLSADPAPFRRRPVVPEPVEPLPLRIVARHSESAHGRASDAKTSVA